MRELQALGQAFDAGWQGMYTAPIDGTAILALLTGSDLPHIIRWQRQKWIIAWDGYDLSSACDEPTHWMAIPPLPVRK